MTGHSLPITDAVAQNSPLLGRMRLDGHDCVTVPFAESYVQAWLSGPQQGDAASTLINGIEV